jgi:hypothetical protein
MPSMRSLRTVAFCLMASALSLLSGPRCHAQAALLLEQPYGFFGALNPTGHLAIYFERICSETPVKLRRCEPGEMGVVVSRYQGMAGYDWVAIPLLPYLYSVDDPALVPERASHETVARLRDKYHEENLLSLGDHLQAGNMLHGGWKELVGVAYERRIYAIRFDTTEAQDDAFIARMNDGKNRSHFELWVNNCADFARVTLNYYFPGTFKRNIFPDAGVTTPKQIAYKLVHYGRKHPDASVTVFEIPQIPGNRRPSGTNKDIAEALITTGYAIPIAVLNPYLAGALLVDYLARGHRHFLPKNPEILGPDNLAELTASGGTNLNRLSSNDLAPRPPDVEETESPSSTIAIGNPSQKEITAEHE